MEFWFLLVQIVPALALVYYFYIRHKTSYWSKRGIDGPKPFLIWGNLIEVLRRGQIVTEMEWMRKYGKIYGTYFMMEPTVAISDPELIKQITIKDFNLFVNRRKANANDEIADKHLFNLEGDDWKRVRSITSPSFTSGKLRGMNLLMNHCIDKFINYFETISKNGDGVIDTKKVVSGFTIDVIASTSFATETNANDDRSGENQFIKNGMSLFKLKPGRLFLALLFPTFVSKLVNKVFPLKDFVFFVDLCKQVVKQRRETKVKRNDFVQLLMDAYVSENELQSFNYDKLAANNDKEVEVDSEQKQTKSKAAKTLDDNEIIAQCFLFFLAGFETTGSTISHCIFELAQNPEIQDRLVQELHSALDGLDINSEQYYEAVTTKIPYLDAVIKETLRMYPPLAQLERRVGVEGYKLGGITLQKEQLVTISAYTVHHNPEYYPDPESFNPDRFLPENKHLLTPYTYLPFGQGPRNCIGMRFAYQEIKLCFAKIFPKFRFSPTTGTPEKLEFANIGLLSVKPFPLKVTKRV